MLRAKRFLLLLIDLVNVYENRTCSISAQFNSSGGERWKIAYKRALESREEPCSLSYVHPLLYCRCGLIAKKRGSPPFVRA